MKKTMTILLLTLAVFSLGAATVYVGGEAGGNTNAIIAGEGYSGYTYTPASGSSISVPVVVEFSYGMGLETGLSYVKKSYDYDKYIKVAGTEGTLFKYSVENGFLEIPVLFRYSFAIAGSRWNVFAAVGGFAGFWLSGMRTGAVYGFSSERPVEEKTDLSYYNWFQAGVTASAGIGYSFTSCEVYVKAGYSLTLTDLNRSQKHASYPVHNSTVTVAAGILWGINK